MRNLECQEIINELKFYIVGRFNNKPGYPNLFSSYFLGSGSWGLYLDPNLDF